MVLSMVPAMPLTASALGHSYGEDGICANCGNNKNSITINMTDAYGDGWNGNAIFIYEDGVHTTTVTIGNGYSSVWTGKYNPQREYSFYWSQGSYSYECAFEILIGDEVIFTATTTDCYNFANGQRIHPVCEHSFNADWVCPGCGMSILCTVDIGGTVTPYMNFKDAVNAACAADAATIKLYQDVSSGGYDFVAGNVTVDLNGNDLCGSVRITGSTLTLTDTAEQKGTLVNSGTTALEYYSGQLIFMDTVNLALEGTEQWYMFGAVGGTTTIGSTGTENIVIPAIA
jgi:hypothetical protein